MVFGELIVAYLFLGGAGGGACVVAGVLGCLADGADMQCGLRARFRDERGGVYRRFFVSSLTAALAALVFGVLCLLADVGRPDRVILLLLSAPSTYLAVGAWALLTCAALALAAILVWCGAVPSRLVPFRALNALLAVAGFVTVLYTGLLLSSMPSVPLWNTPWLVAVFVLSGLSCGVALVLLAALTVGALGVFGAVVRQLVRIDTLVIAVEAAAVVLWLGSVWASSTAAGADATATDAAALASLESLCAGSQAPGLWLGLVAIGLVFPALLERVSLARPQRAARGMVARPTPSGAAFASGLILAASLCVLFGGACLRYLVVAAALLPVSVFPL